MKVRAASLDEVDAVLAVWWAADVVSSATDDAASLRRLLTHDPDALLVAVVDDLLVGTLIAAWDGWRGDLYRLAVLPEHRRRGFARALVAEGERRLRGRGAVRITALVEGADERAVAFWTAVGYGPDPRNTRHVKTVSATP